MRILTKKQLEILEPLKKIVSKEFYEIQKASMLGNNDRVLIERSAGIAQTLTEKQIKKCREVRQQLKEYKKSFQAAIDMVREGLDLLEEGIL